MPPRPPAPCPHELRPGTTVCLHCRHKARLAESARLRTLLARGAASLAVIGVATAGVMTLRRGDDAPETSRVAAATVAEQPGAEQQVAEHASALGPRPSAPAVSGPIIPEGRTELRGGVVAVRTGDTVSVHFDMPATRTRRRDKFERMVRAALPAIYGSAADSALAAVPDGRLAAAGDLLTELPTRGLRLPTPNGILALWPATRPGRDGPLVVTYVATLQR